MGARARVGGCSVKLERGYREERGGGGGGGKE